MFGAQNEGKRSAAIRALKASPRRLLAAGEDDAVVVSELRCVEPGCPPIETVVALLREGNEPLQLKVHKPAVDVTDEDLRSALLEADAHAYHQ
ncbi:MAG TPA: hypothetical protein VGC79_19065 [Polyangiaceae bacterium]